MFNKYILAKVFIWNLISCYECDGETTKKLNYSYKKEIKKSHLFKEITNSFDLADIKSFRNIKETT